MAGAARQAAALLLLAAAGCGPRPADPAPGAVAGVRAGAEHPGGTGPLLSLARVPLAPPPAPGEGRGEGDAVRAPGTLRLRARGLLPGAPAPGEEPCEAVAMTLLDGGTAVWGVAYVFAPLPLGGRPFSLDVDLPATAEANGLHAYALEAACDRHGVVRSGVVSVEIRVAGPGPEPPAVSWEATAPIARAGAPAAWRVRATGSGARFQWQRLAPGRGAGAEPAAFEDLPGATGDSLVLVPGPGDDGAALRVRVCDRSGLVCRHSDAYVLAVSPEEGAGPGEGAAPPGPG
jgi:hypothetical protein